MGWIAFITILFVLPPNLRAGMTSAGLVLLLGVYYFAWARRRFAGPPILGR